MDELDSRIRAARPGSVTRSTPLSARAEVDLARLLSAHEALKPDTSARPTRRWMSLSSAAAVVAAVMVVLVVWGGVVPPSDAAQTPPPLELSSSSEDVEVVVSRASNLLGAGGGRSTAERRSDSTGWYLQIDYVTDSPTRVAISPEVTKLVWHADLSGRRIITAGVPYWADGSVLPVDSGTAPEPGTVLFDTVYRQGEFEPLVSDTPGNSSEETELLLRAHGMPLEPSASDVIQALSLALGHWTLTNSQHEHALAMIASAGDASVAGRGIDRAGRTVVALTTDSTSNPNFRYLALISEETGRIVGVETLRRVPSDDLPAGAVTSYTLWDVESI